MTDITYNRSDKWLKTPKELLAKGKRLWGELEKNNIKNHNIKRLVDSICLLYKEFQKTNTKSHKLRIEFQNKEDFKYFIDFFQFTKWKKIKNTKWIHTTMSKTNSQSLLIPSLSLFVETFIDYKNNIHYSKKYIVFSK